MSFLTYNTLLTPKKKCDLFLYWTDLIKKWEEKINEKSGNKSANGSFLSKQKLKFFVLYVPVWYKNKFKSCITLQCNVFARKNCHLQDGSATPKQWPKHLTTILQQSLNHSCPL